MERKRSVPDERRAHPIPFGRDAIERQVQAAKRPIPDVRPCYSAWREHLEAKLTTAPSHPADRIKEVLPGEVAHRSAEDAIADMARLAAQIHRGMERLEWMLG